MRGEVQRRCWHQADIEDPNSGGDKALGYAILQLYRALAVVPTQRDRRLLLRQVLANLTAERATYRFRQRRRQILADYSSDIVFTKDVLAQCSQP